MLTEPKNRLSSKALKVWRISGVIKSLIGWFITAIILFLLHIFHGPNWIAYLLISLGIIFPLLHIYLFPLLSWKRWRYEVRQEEIELLEGMFIITRTLIPIIRVQHVDTVQGPILRKNKLASVVVHTAATTHEIPAIEEYEAEELRVFISKLARVAEDDV